MRHHRFEDGRYVVRLDAGEDVIASLTAFATEAHIEAGFLSGIGSVDRLVLGFLDPEAKEYQKRTFEEPMEVASFTASISMQEDRPMIHAHAVVAPRELLAYAGHVHSARVGAVLEVVVLPLPGRLERHPLPDQPFLGLILPGETPPQAAAGTR